MSDYRILLGENNSGKTYNLIQKEIESKIAFKKAYYATLEEKKEMEYIPISSLVLAARTTIFDNTLNNLQIKTTISDVNINQIILENDNLIVSFEEGDKEKYYITKHEQIKNAILYICDSVDTFYYDELIKAIEFIFGENATQYTNQIKMVEKSKNTLNYLQSLSDGVLSIITIFSNIIYDICRPYFCLTKKEKSSEELANVEGTLLIDEYENHLHPNVQLRLKEYLEEFWPKINVEISTHSPLTVYLFEGAEVIEIFRQSEENTVKHLEENDVIDSLEAILAFYFKYNKLPQIISDFFQNVDNYLQGKDKEYTLLINSFDEVKDKYPTLYKEYENLIIEMKEDFRRNEHAIC